MNAREALQALGLTEDDLTTAAVYISDGIELGGLKPGEPAKLRAAERRFLEAARRLDA